MKKFRADRLPPFDLIDPLIFSTLILQATGMTPLMYAVKDNRTSYLDRLIDLGSDVGARNNVSFVI